MHGVISKSYLFTTFGGTWTLSGRTLESHVTLIFANQRRGRGNTAIHDMPTLTMENVA